MVAHQFSVYLLSNVRKPGNSTAAFTTTLAKSLQFNSNWQVALSSIAFPCLWNNVGTFTLQFIDINWVGGRRTRLYCPSTLVKSTTDLEHYLRAVIAEGYLCSLDSQPQKRAADPVIQEGRKKAVDPAYIDSQRAKADQLRDKAIDAGRAKADALKDAFIDKGRENAEKVKDKVIDAGRAKADEVKSDYIDKQRENVEQAKEKVIDAGRAKADALKDAFIDEGRQSAATLKDTTIAQGRADANRIRDQFFDQNPDLKREFEKQVLEPFKEQNQHDVHIPVPLNEDLTPFPKSNVNFYEPQRSNIYTKHACKNVRSEFPQLSADLKIHFQPALQKFKVDLNSKTIAGVEFSQQLAFILGLAQPMVTGAQTAAYLVDLRAGVECLFVYAKGLIEHSPVGDKMAPLLRIVQIRGEQGSLVEEAFLNLEFHRLIDKQVHEINIEIRSNTGQLIPFNSGDERKMHAVYNADSESWADFFQDQYGGQSSSNSYYEGLAFARGPRQVGSGLGAILGTAMSYLLPLALPVVKQVGQQVGQEGLALGGRLLDRIAEGQPLKQAARNELKQSVKNLSKRPQIGQGRRRGHSLIGKRLRTVASVPTPPPFAPPRKDPFEQ